MMAHISFQNGLFRHSGYNKSFAFCLTCSHRFGLQDFRRLLQIVKLRRIEHLEWDVRDAWVDESWHKEKIGGHVA